MKQARDYARKIRSGYLQNCGEATAYIDGIVTHLEKLKDQEAVMKLNMLGFLGFLGLLGFLGSALDMPALYGLFALFALFGMFGYNENKKD